MLRNIDIRNYIKESGLFLWEVAEALGISDTTFSKRLRKELSKDEKQKIIEVIRVIKSKN